MAADAFGILAIILIALCVLCFYGAWRLSRRIKKAQAELDARGEAKRNDAINHK